uniref:Uncharacterized protein n=1 Tax=Picea glauca TaxID=3330 RepID=A0A117NIC4_PICGL|nr:hypothetical protein ABT39_MTgene2911 [Picea glauca]
MGPSLPGRGSLCQQIRRQGNFPSDEGVSFPKQRHNLPEMPCLYYVTVCCCIVRAVRFLFCSIPPGLLILLLQQASVRVWRTSQTPYTHGWHSSC